MLTKNYGYASVFLCLLNIISYSVYRKGSLLCRGMSCKLHTRIVVGYKFTNPFF